jgi:hypothetical protein
MRRIKTAERAADEGEMIAISGVDPAARCAHCLRRSMRKLRQIVFRSSSLGQRGNRIAKLLSLDRGGPAVEAVQIGDPQRFRSLR